MIKVVSSTVPRMWRRVKEILHNNSIHHLFIVDKFNPDMIFLISKLYVVCSCYAILYTISNLESFFW